MNIINQHQHIHIRCASYFRLLVRVSLSLCVCVCHARMHAQGASEREREGREIRTDARVIGTDRSCSLDSCLEEEKRSPCSLSQPDAFPPCAASARLSSDASHRASTRAPRSRARWRTHAMPREIARYRQRTHSRAAEPLAIHAECAHRLTGALVPEEVDARVEAAGTIGERRG